MTTMPRSLSSLVSADNMNHNDYCDYYGNNPTQQNKEYDHIKYVYCCCPCYFKIIQYCVISTIFIAPAYSRVRYRSSNFRTFVRSFVRSYVRQHLRRSSVFSTSVIAASLKPCILIVLDIPFKHAP